MKLLSLLLSFNLIVVVPTNDHNPTTQAKNSVLVVMFGSDLVNHIRVAARQVFSSSTLNFKVIHEELPSSMTRRNVTSTAESICEASMKSSTAFSIPPSFTATIVSLVRYLKTNFHYLIVPVLPIYSNSSECVIAFDVKDFGIVTVLLLLAGGKASDDISEKIASAWVELVSSRNSAAADKELTHKNFHTIQQLLKKRSNFPLFVRYRLPYPYNSITSTEMNNCQGSSCLALSHNMLDSIEVVSFSTTFESIFGIFGPLFVPCLLSVLIALKKLKT